MFLKNLSFLIILNWRIRRLLQVAIAASDAWTSWFFSVNLLKRFAKAHWGLVHTNTFSFETHLFLCILRQCFVKESRSFWKCSPKWKTLTTPFSRCSVDCEKRWHMFSHVTHIVPIDDFCYRCVTLYTLKNTGLKTTQFGLFLTQGLGKYRTEPIWG